MNQLNCVISYFFQLHLMLHACIQKFDVTCTVQTFLGNKRQVCWLLVEWIYINDKYSQTWITIVPQGCILFFIEPNSISLQLNIVACLTKFLIVSIKSWKNILFHINYFHWQHINQQFCSMKGPPSKRINKRCKIHTRKNELVRSIATMIL